MIDSDAAVRSPTGNRPGPRHWDMLAMIAAGGLVGAEARYGVAELLPHRPGQLAWSTVLINVSGSLLIGALMVVLLELTAPHRLIRPFLGIGILGGYTTFSTFSVDAQQMILAHRVGSALLYVVTTVVLCLFAVWLGSVTARILGRQVVGGSGRRHRGRTR